MDEMFSVIEGLTKEMAANIKDMSKTKDIDQKKKRAEVVKLLAETMAVFFDAMGMGDFGLYDDLPDEIHDDDIVDFKSIKKKSKKKRDDDDMPF